MKKILVIALFTVMAISCRQWRVSSLKNKEFSFIKNGKSIGSIKINTDEYALENLSFKLGIFNGYICTADNNLKRVQVIEPEGSVKLTIGKVKDIEKKNLNLSSFNFNIIGTFTMDKDDNIYVQNRFQNSTGNAGRKYGKRADEDINFSPSYVLVFNEEGKLQYTIGQEGTPDIPFYHIEKLDIDGKGRLFVISRSFNSWTLFRFENGKRDFFADLSKIEFKEKEGDDEYTGKIENIKMFKDGEKILLSVAYYHGIRLKYRKIYEYSISKKEVIRMIVNIPDPKNVLFNIIDDKHIYFWDMEGKDIRFMICNMEGNVINNIFLDVNKNKNYYTRIISDDAGGIYSYHVMKKGIKIFEWE
jgi:hypothetical protein